MVVGIQTTECLPVRCSANCGSHPLTSWSWKKTFLTILNSLKPVWLWMKSNARQVQDDMLGLNQQLKAFQSIVIFCSG